MSWSGSGSGRAAGGPLVLSGCSGEAGVHFTTRVGGVSEGPFASLDLGLHVGDDPKAVRANRAEVMGALGLSPRAMTCVRQVHGRKVVRIRDEGVGLGSTDLPEVEADALVTDVQGAALCVLVADCVPVLFAAAASGGDHGYAVGAAHAGWRGVAGGVVPATTEALAGAFGAAPEAVSVWIGPHIRACCYQVDASLAEAFRQRFGREAIAGRDPAAGERLAVGERGGAYLDLEACIRIQLADAGIREGAVRSTGLCTACRTDLFYSFRRATGGRTGRSAGVVALGARLC